MADRRIPPGQRISVNCNDCGLLLIEVEQKTDDELTINPVNGLGIQAPATGLQPDGIAIAVCPKCQGKMEFPAKYLPL